MRCVGHMVQSREPIDYIMWQFKRLHHVICVHSTSILFIWPVACVNHSNVFSSCMFACLYVYAGRQAVGVSESNIGDYLNHDRTHAQKISWLCIIWLNVLWRKPIVCNAPDRDNSAQRLGIQLKRDRLRCVGGMRDWIECVYQHMSTMNCIYTRHMIACQTLNFQVQKNQIRLKRDGKLFTL